MEGWMDRLTGGWMINGRMDGYISWRMDGWMDDKWKDGWID